MSINRWISNQLIKYKLFINVRRGIDKLGAQCASKMLTALKADDKYGDPMFMSVKTK